MADPNLSIKVSSTLLVHLTMYSNILPGLALPGHETSRAGVGLSADRRWLEQMQKTSSSMRKSATWRCMSAHWLPVCLRLLCSRGHSQRDALERLKGKVWSSRVYVCAPIVHGFHV